MAEDLKPELFNGSTKSFSNLVLNNVQDGVAGLNSGRQIVFWNKAAEQMTGFEAPEVLGKPGFKDLSLFVDR